MKTWLHESLFKGFAFTDDCDADMKQDEVPDELVARHAKVLEEFRAVNDELSRVYQGGRNGG